MRQRTCQVHKTFVPKHVAGRIVVADDDDIARAFYHRAADSLGVSSDELRAVAVGMDVGFVNGPPARRTALFRLYS